MQCGKVVKNVHQQLMSLLHIAVSLIQTGTCAVAAACCKLGSHYRAPSALCRLALCI